MNINRLTTLAFTMYSNKGAYAVLLGSGVSRLAHIPSSWDVENALIEKLAAIQGVSEVPDMHAWYKKQFGKEADYSTLLNELVSTKTERVGLMKSFFEPSNTDIEMGWKKPTIAHMSIAKLAKDGYIKVIMTTNFDRLMEEALNQEGVSYQVVLHESDLEKITPLTHCTIPTIVKINGDYIDCRFRNTTSELSSYPNSLSVFLSRIFEDYGLITSGWSATWDYGLSNIIRNSSPSRYNSFFSYVDSFAKELSALSDERHGEMIKIEGADILFSELYEQVSALQQNDISKSLGNEILISRAEKYLEDKNDIKLTKLIEELTEKAVNFINSIADYSKQLNIDSFNYYLSRHHEAVSSLMDIAIIIGRWGKAKHVELIGNSLVRLCILPRSLYYGTDESTKYIHGMAASLLLNALGVSCVFYDNYEGLNMVVKKEVPGENFISQNYRLKLLTLIGNSFWGNEELRKISGNRALFPLSKIIYGELKKHFNKLINPESEFEGSYYKWEHLKSLLVGYYKCHFNTDYYFPIGNFIDYEYNDYSFPQQITSPYRRFFDNANILKDEWPPIKQGLFDGKYEKYKKIYDISVEYYKNNRYVGHL